jgi:hypothetical protein
MTRITPMKAIRQYCVWCCHRQSAEVRECPSPDCDLYSRRMGREDKSVVVEKRLTAKQAIRARCVDCSGSNPRDISLCKITDCRLWAHRMKKNPYPHAGKGNVSMLLRYRKNLSG